MHDDVTCSLIATGLGRWRMPCCLEPASMWIKNECKMTRALLNVYAHVVLKLGLSPRSTLRSRLTRMIVLPQSMIAMRYI